MFKVVNLTAVSISKTFNAYFELVRHTYPGEFADAYIKALKDLYNECKNMENNEAPLQTLTRLFEYGDLEVARREAKMIEDQTGYS